MNRDQLRVIVWGIYHRRIDEGRSVSRASLHECAHQIGARGSKALGSHMLTYAVKQKSMAVPLDRVMAVVDTWIRCNSKPAAGT